MTSPDDYAKHFDQVRSQQAYVEDADASRKSSIDAHCRQLVDAINASPNYFTTSSCSGRFLAFAQAAHAHVKQNCQWLSVSHDPLSEQQIGEFVALMAAEHASYDQVFLKFEPFILHVCCRDLSYAKRMLEQAVASGYRNSGISLGSAKIILAIRSTQNMEAPISDGGRLLVDSNYIEHVCRKANSKFAENFERIDRLFHNLKSECLEESGAKKEDKRAERAQQRLEKREYYAGLKAAGVLRTGQEVRRGQLACGHIEEKNIDQDNADLFDLVK